MTLAICCLIAPPTLSGLGSSLPKIKRRSRTTILTTPSNGVTSIEILSQLRSNQLMTRKRWYVAFSAQKDQCIERSLEISSASNQKRWRPEFLPVTYGRAKFCTWWTTRDSIMRKSPGESWRISRWSGYPIHPIPRTSLRAISMHFEAWKTSAEKGPWTTSSTWSSHCGPELRPGFKTFGGRDLKNFQSDGEQSQKHVESTTKKVGMLKLLILAIKLKFWESVITCVLPY